jgi:hypothetical protein
VEPGAPQREAASSNAAGLPAPRQSPFEGLTHEHRVQQVRALRTEIADLERDDRRRDPSIRARIRARRELLADRLVKLGYRSYSDFVRNEGVDEAINAAPADEAPRVIVEHPDPSRSLDVPTPTSNGQHGLPPSPQATDRSPSADRRAAEFFEGGTGPRGDPQIDQSPEQVLDVPGAPSPRHEISLEPPEGSAIGASSEVRQAPTLVDVACPSGTRPAERGAGASIVAHGEVVQLIADLATAVRRAANELHVVAERAREDKQGVEPVPDYKSADATDTAVLLGRLETLVRAGNVAIPPDVNKTGDLATSSAISRELALPDVEETSRPVRSLRNGLVVTAVVAAHVLAVGGLVYALENEHTSVPTPQRAASTTPAAPALPIVPPNGEPTSRHAPSPPTTRSASPTTQRSSETPTTRKISPAQAAAIFGAFAHPAPPTTDASDVADANAYIAAYRTECNDLWKHAGPDGLLWDPEDRESGGHKVAECLSSADPTDGIGYDSPTEAAQNGKSDADSWVSDIPLGNSLEPTNGPPFTLPQ